MLFMFPFNSIVSDAYTDFIHGILDDAVNSSDNVVHNSNITEK